MPQDFEIGLIKDARVESRAYVSTIIQTETDRSEHQSPCQYCQYQRSFKFSNTSSKCELEKPLETATIKFDIGEHTIAKHFIELMNFRGPFKELALGKT